MNRGFLIFRVTVMSGLLLAAMVTSRGDVEQAGGVSTIGVAHAPTLTPQGNDLCDALRVGGAAQDSIVRACREATSHQ